MAGYLNGKVAVVFGAGTETHRAVAVALAQAGADIAVAGVAPELSAEAALHSISNEVWAFNRRSAVVTLEADDAPSFAQALHDAAGQLGRADLVVRSEDVGTA